MRETRAAYADGTQLPKAGRTKQTQQDEGVCACGGISEGLQPGELIQQSGATGNKGQRIGFMWQTEAQIRRGKCSHFSSYCGIRIRKQFQSWKELPTSFPLISSFV